MSCHAGPPKGIQQLLDRNLHWDALNDDCWIMIKISWGISRQLPKRPDFVRYVKLRLYQIREAGIHGMVNRS